MASSSLTPSFRLLRSPARNLSNSARTSEPGEASRARMRASCRSAISRTLSAHCSQKRGLEYLSTTVARMASRNSGEPLIANGSSICSVSKPPPLRSPPSSPMSSCSGYSGGVSTASFNWFILASNLSSCADMALMTCHTALYALSFTVSCGDEPGERAMGRMIYPIRLPGAFRITLPTA